VGDVPHKMMSSRDWEDGGAELGLREAVVVRSKADGRIARVRRRSGRSGGLPACGGDFDRETQRSVGWRTREEPRRDVAKVVLDKKSDASKNKKEAAKSDGLKK